MVGGARPRVDHDPPGNRSRSVIVYANMDLALDQIRSVLAVVDYGGYHRAAEALHLSQPAISKHVRRIEQQLGGPLFERRGRGVEVSARGEAVVGELRRIVEAHDEALARLARPAGAKRPFALGTIEHLVDPMLPEVLSAVRGRLDVPVRLRVDRSLPLVERVEAGELDAAIVMNPSGAAAPEPLGDVELRWWTGAGLRVDPLPEPLPVVAYDPPCGLREMQLRHLADQGIASEVTAESPHLTGIQAAVRSGLGVALLAGGADGLRPVASGPLGETLSAPLWLVAADQWRNLAEPLRGAIWAATARARRKAA
jgi:DNA-binding transcriptional LysR family regulator